MQTWNVSILRGKDFRNRHRSFKGWSPDKKRNFVSELYAIAEKHIVRGGSSTVRKNYYQECRKLNKSLTNVAPLRYAFASCLQAFLFKDELSSIHFQDHQVDVVMEKENKNDGNVARYFEWFKNSDSYLQRRLGTLRFCGKRDCRAIQLADFLAFHARRDSDKWAASGYKLRASTSEVMKIMISCIGVRHSRLYHASESPLRFDMWTLPQNQSAAILPEGGLR